MILEVTFTSFKCMTGCGDSDAGSAAPIPPGSVPSATTAIGSLPTGAPVPSSPSGPLSPLNPNNNSSNNSGNSNGICTTRRIRKSWQELSGQERTTFINALHSLKQMPSIQGRSNRYEDFVADHGDATRHAHSNVGPVCRLPACAPSHSP